MKKNLQALKNRRYPLEEARPYHFSQAALSNESYEWLVEATQPIDPKYTNQTFEQGDRVKEQLEANLKPEFLSEFEYQGSVSSDTHVKFHSDIDLLVLHGNYTSYPVNYPIASPVSNEVVVDALVSLRSEATQILRTKFPKANVDSSGAKAISVSGGSLTRDIDVVVCNWWHTPEYLQVKVLANRGICVLDLHNQSRINNKPFLHNWHINDKDAKVGGCLRKAIRLVKNLKYDRQPSEARISSYDIAALMFNMSDADLIVPSGAYLQLAKRVSFYLNSLIGDTSKRDSLFVPNGTRKVFGTGGATLDLLKEITKELDELLGEISSSEAQLIALSESFGSLTNRAPWNEARASRVQQLNNRFLRAA